MRKYKIFWVSWNSAHPFKKFLGVVLARSPEHARNQGRKEWPCGNNQIYEAEEV